MKELKRVRQRRGLSQAETAVRAGLSPASVWRFEAGQRSPTIEQLKQLAVALDVEVAEFLPKAQAPLQLDFDGVAGHPERERLLSYLKTSEKLIERMRRRWKAAAEENTFSYAAWSEAVSVVVDFQTAFVEAVPVTVYATGEQYLPQEEWEAVAVTLGSLSILRDSLLVAYASRFGEEDVPDNTVNLDDAREQKRRLREVLRAGQGSNIA